MTAQQVDPTPRLITYAWPPLPVLDPDEAGTILAERLQAAWDDLEAERIRVLLSLTMGRKDLVNRWLLEFEAGIEEFLASVSQNVERFLTLHLGPQYVEGVLATGAQVMSWTLAHQTALTSLATDTYDDFLRRAREAERVSESFVRAVRQAAKDELPKIAAGGRTAAQVADRLEERLLTQYGIDTVTYRNGAQVTVRTYARMVARTKSAVAYSAGKLNEGHAAGVRWVEVFDGSDCGWTSHTDGDKANGTIRHIEDAGEFVISHPNCVRDFGLRPDVRTKQDAKNARPSTTVGQRADQRENVDFGTARTNNRQRATEVRRARTAMKRQARQLGATDPEQIGAIIDRIMKKKGLS